MWLPSSSAETSATPSARRTAPHRGSDYSPVPRLHGASTGVHHVPQAELRAGDLAPEEQMNLIVALMSDTGCLVYLRAAAACSVPSNHPPVTGSLAESASQNSRADHALFVSQRCEEAAQRRTVPSLRMYWPSRLVDPQTGETGKVWFCK
jgi:hypothetical protein